jgi:hypothetical protein
VANNRLSDVLLTGLRSTTFVEKVSEIAAVMAKKMRFISIEGVRAYFEKNILFATSPVLLRGECPSAYFRKLF